MRKGILSVVLSGLTLQAAYAAAGDDVKALLEAGQPAAAYEKGHAQGDQFGQPVFDFYYGIAAIDSGHAGEGVLALERYLLNFPDNRSARFHLARGYFVLGEDQRARDEFEQILGSADGIEKTTVERYLDAIRARESRYLPTASAFVEVGVGYDTNINAGVSGPNLGTMGTISPTSTSLHAEDSFVSLVGGVQGTYPLAPSVTAFGALVGDFRYHLKGENGIFDLSNWNGQGGVSIISGRNLYKLYLGLSDIAVDNQRFLTNTSLNGEWQVQWDELNRLIFGLQYADLAYHDTRSVTDRTLPAVVSFNTVRSADFYAANAAWVRSFVHPMQPTLYLGMSYGVESNKGTTLGVPNPGTVSEQNSRAIVGLRAAVSFTPLPRWGASVGYSFQESNYRGPWAGSSEDRYDRYNAVDLSLSYFYSRNLTLKSELSYADQSSNFALGKYDRTIFALKARYDFK